MDEVPFRYLSNYDGDTIHGEALHSFTGTIAGIHAPLSGQVWLPIGIRVLGIDTEEIKSHSVKSKQAKVFTEQWCKAGMARTGLIIVTEWEIEKYGRTLAYVQRDETGEDLTERLIEVGLGVAYAGGKRG